MIQFFICFFCFLLSLQSTARVLDFNKESLASYLLVGGATTTLADGAWAKESTATGFGSSITKYYNGEFGFLFLQPKFLMRLGLEVIQAPTLSDVTATNAAGTTLYKIRNEMQTLNPKLGIEFTLSGSPQERVFWGGYYGTASLTLKKSYSESTLTPTGSHNVEATSTSTTSGYYLGYERHFSDTNTFVFEMGYRTLEFEELNYSKSLQTFVGNVSSGATVLDTAGNSRTVSMTGPYVNMGIRFYIF